MTASSENPPPGEETDIGTLWQEALIRYYEECGTDLRAVPPARLNIEHIIAEQDHQLLLFSEYRHNKGKVDKLRSLISKNSEIVVGVATHIANAASAAFPPSSAILTAFNYVMNASKVVSEDYDMIVSFFDIMNSFLERVSMLQSRMPSEWQFRRFLVNVFSAMMTLSAIARKCRQKGRLSKWAKALVDGSDPKLKGAFDSLHMHLERFESVAMLTTLKHTLESSKKLDVVGLDVKQIQAGVQQNLAISQQNYLLGLESKGHAQDAAYTSHEILTVVTRQDERGAEYTAGLQQVMKTLNKMSKTKGVQDQVVDAGSRKSIAMKALQTSLDFELDDKVHLAEIETHYVNGTYSWFLEEEVYTEFEAGNVPNLWVSGAAGMGKSTMAYSVVKALQREFIGDATTSVAHYFFRDEEERKSADKMLRSCALQVAAQDHGYREEAVADVQLYLRSEASASHGKALFQDYEQLWELLFRKRFSKKSGRRLVLVLDGLDELSLVQRSLIVESLEYVGVMEEEFNVRVLFTSDPSVYSPDMKMTKAKVFEVTKELVLPDMRTIIVSRLRVMGRLRKLSQKTKKKIVLKLSKQADTMRYIDHMLRRLNQLGREKAILRELERLPSDTIDLYRMLLDDCQKGRTEQDIVVLKKFFAWLAYTRGALSIASASKLLYYIASDNNISIDEELEHRCARLLRLSSTPNENDEDNNDDSDSDSLDDEKALDDDEDNFEDAWVLLGFQERGLRDYFRPDNNPGGDKLRSSYTLGHAMVFETMASILCNSADDSADIGEKLLLSDVAKNWAHHLMEIEPTNLTVEERARVIESVCSILSNIGGSIRKLEAQCLDAVVRHPACILGNSETVIDGTVFCLKHWAVAALELPPGSISGATLAWMRPFARQPRSIFIKLADAHVTNWLSGSGNQNGYILHGCFMFAHGALYLGRELPAVQQSEQLKKYFEARERSPEFADAGSTTIESFTVVSKAFLHIDMTAQSYLAIALSMYYDNMFVSALRQLDLALEHADTDVVEMEILMRVAEIKLEFASSQGSITEPHLPVEGNSEGEPSIEDDPEESEHVKTWDEECDKWNRESLDAAKRATAIAETLSPSALYDVKVRTIVRDAWMLRAKTEVILGDPSNTVTYCEKATAVCRKEDYLWHFDLFRPLGEMKQWATFIDAIKALSINKAAGWMYLGQCGKQLQTAAVATGQVEWLLDMYRDAAIMDNLRWIQSTILIEWAGFHQIIGTTDAIVKAKVLLNKVVDSHGEMENLTQASFRLSDLLLEEFRHTIRPSEKLAAYREMQDVVRRIKEAMGTEFDPTQSQTMIPLAHMTRRMDAFEYQQSLERTFAGCVEALTDDVGWNDKLSMRVLARVLALVGLERDAQIAATCQIYVIDMEIFNRENEWRVIHNDDDGSFEGGEEFESGGGGSYEGSYDGESNAGEGEASVDGEDDAIPEPVAGNPVSPVSPKPKEGKTDDEDARSETGKTEGTKEEGEGGEVSDAGGDIAAGYLNWAASRIICKGCNVEIPDWTTGPVYLCYYCAEADLCQKCFDKRAKKISGEPIEDEDWRLPCPEGHRHIQAPVQGWGSLWEGNLTIDDEKIPFSQWLLELKEKRWPEAWERFWADEQL